MKIRSVHPEFFTDPTLAELSAHARLLYIGLWCLADDDGRGEWLPKAIEGRVFPFEQVNIVDLLNELIDDAKVARYEVAGRNYWWLPNFSRWQNPRYKRNSTIPPPPSHNPAQTSRNISPTRGNSSRQEGEGEGVGEGVEVIARARNEWWDTLVELFGEPTPQQRSLYGRIVQTAKHTGPASEIVRRAEGIVLEWGRKALTPASLEKHWTRFDGAVASISDDQVAASVKRRELERPLDVQ